MTVFGTGSCITVMQRIGLYKREFYSKFCPNAEIKPDVTYISINVGDSSTGIIEKIVTNFGGWISVT